MPKAKIQEAAQELLGKIENCRDSKILHDLTLHYGGLRGDTPPDEVAAIRHLRDLLQSTAPGSARTTLMLAIANVSKSLAESDAKAVFDVGITELKAVKDDQGYFVERALLPIALRLDGGDTFEAFSKISDEISQPQVRLMFAEDVADRLQELFDKLPAEAQGQHGAFVQRLESGMTVGLGIVFQVIGPSLDRRDADDAIEFILNGLKGRSLNDSIYLSFVRALPKIGNRLSEQTQASLSVDLLGQIDRLPSADPLAQDKNTRNANQVELDRLVRGLVALPNLSGSVAKKCVERTIQSLKANNSFYSAWNLNRRTLYLAIRKLPADERRKGIEQILAFPRATDLDEFEASLEVTADLVEQCPPGDAEIIFHRLAEMSHSVKHPRLLKQLGRGLDAATAKSDERKLISFLDSFLCVGRVRVAVLTSLRSRQQADYGNNVWRMLAAKRTQ